MLDWRLEPVQVIRNEYGQDNFVLETFGGTTTEGMTIGSAPLMAVGDSVYLMGQTKTDGRLVAANQHILVQKNAGETYDGAGMAIVALHIDGSVEGVICGPVYDMATDATEDVPCPSNIVTWSSAVAELNLLVRQSTTIEGQRPPVGRL